MKISEIIINNYRAFYNEKGTEKTKYKLDIGTDKNLLIYGENGSGKTSLFRGMKDLFQSSLQPGLPLIQNVFSKQDAHDIDPFIEIVFTEGINRYTFTFSSDTLLTNTDHNILKSVARSRCFMSYRDLLRVHFVEGAEVNLFRFLFGSEGLLGDLSNPVYSRPETNIKMSLLLIEVENRPDRINRQDFTNGVNQILSDLNTHLNHLLKYFDASLQVKFTALKEADLEAGTPEIKIEVSYFGIPLNAGDEQYHHFLNEARLSALSICIFLATHLATPSPDYQILFLDDIFTGLDTSNRIPLLDILTDEVIKGTNGDSFTNHQIILTTYDRNWYEMARNQLSTGRWSFQEFYIDSYSNAFEQPIILPAESDIEKAKFYFKTKQYPACANYQRKICENLIKGFLPEHKKYDVLSNGEIAPVSKLDTFISRFEAYLMENSLSAEPFKKLRNCLRVVMNPLSHDDFVSPVYRRELELVFDIIEDLKKLKNTILLEAGKQISMRKVNPATGLVRVYVCEVCTPIRRLESSGQIKYSNFNILPLSQKEGEQKKIKISYGGKFEEVYKRFCHSLAVPPAADPLTEFELTDGTPLHNLFQ